MADWVRSQINQHDLAQSVADRRSVAAVTQRRLLYLLCTLREGPKDRKRSTSYAFEELGYPTFGHIVPRASATFASDPPISVHANHSHMVKFGTPRDEGFQSVVAELRWTNELR
jgi:hypothetical protein